MVIRPVGWQRKERRVVYQFAVRQAKLTERIAFGEEGGNRFVADETALLEVDLEYVGAIFGESENGAVLELDTVIQLEL
jgi:hypothetical protein